jgi:uncharacterized protein YbjT (DUF2867 family)
MIRIAVIGAAGQIGKMICEGIHTSLPDAELITLTRRKEFSSQGFTLFDPEKDDWSILGRVDVLINCAGIIQESKDDAFDQVHIQLVQKIIENRNIIGNPRIIHFSALGAAPLHPIYFLKTKGIGDQIILKQSNAYVIRPSIVCIHDALLVKKFKMLFDMSRYMFNHTLLPSAFSKTRIQPVMPSDLQQTIVQLCTTEQHQKIWNVVGAEELSFGWLMELASSVRNQKIVPVEIPKNLVAAVTKNFISVWFPDLINYDQFQLLFKDHIADPQPMEQLIGKRAEHTQVFWENEFKME